MPVQYHRAVLAGTRLDLIRRPPPPGSMEPAEIRPVASRRPIRFNLGGLPASA
jgi:hypothetical protein